MTPAQGLAAALAALKIPVRSLEAGPSLLRIEFEPSVTAEERRRALELAATWDWSWGRRDARRGD